jgi:hypothetical protein
MKLGTKLKLGIHNATPVTDPEGNDYWACYLKTSDDFMLFTKADVYVRNITDAEMAAWVKAAGGEEYDLSPEPRRDCYKLARDWPSS